MSPAARILIVCGNPIECEGLKQIARNLIASVCYDAVDSVAAAERLAAEHRYDLAILDLGIPGAHGFSCFLQLQHRLAQVPVILLADSWTASLIESARALGAAGYLARDTPLDRVAEAFRAVLEGGLAFPALHGPSDIIKAARIAVRSLSRAQLRVLSALAAGRSNKQIAGELGVTEATIKAHLSATFRKLGVQNRAQALLAMQPLFHDIPSRVN